MFEALLEVVVRNGGWEVWRMMGRCGACCIISSGGSIRSGCSLMMEYNLMEITFQ